MLMETVSNISTRKELYCQFSILSVDYTIGFKYKWRLYSGNTGVSPDVSCLKISGVAWLCYLKRKPREARTRIFVRGVNIPRILVHFQATDVQMPPKLGPK